VLTQSAIGLALRDDEGRIHLLRRSGDQYRTVTSQADWPTYNGQPTGSRFSALTGIDTTNVGRLAPAWTFTLDGASRLEVTPVVVDGVMYATTANECSRGCRSDASCISRPRARSLRRRRGGINCGVASSIACSWSPTTRTSSRSADRPVRCSGTRRWRTGG
jgi:hypothetical protein